MTMCSPFAFLSCFAPPLKQGPSHPLLLLRNRRTCFSPLLCYISKAAGRAPMLPQGRACAGKDK